MATDLTKMVERDWFENPEGIFCGPGGNDLRRMFLAMAKQVEINQAEIESLKTRMAKCQAFIESRTN